MLRLVGRHATPSRSVARAPPWWPFVPECTGGSFGPVNPQTDRLIQELRSQISDNDRAIVRSLSKRVELVARLALQRVAGDRIRRSHSNRRSPVLRDIGRANRGPISQDGLRDLYTRILELTKKEVQ